MSLCGLNKRPSDVYSCLFHAITSIEEEMIGSCATWTEVLQRSVTHNTLTSNKTTFIVWISYLKKSKVENWDFFLPQVTCSVLSASFIFAPQCIFHCLRTWCVVWEWHGGGLQRVNWVGFVTQTLLDAGHFCEVWMEIRSNLHWVWL